MTIMIASTQVEMDPSLNIRKVIESVSSTASSGDDIFHLRPRFLTAILRSRNEPRADILTGSCACATLQIC